MSWFCDAHKPNLIYISTEFHSTLFLSAISLSNLSISLCNLSLSLLKQPNGGFSLRLSSAADVVESRVDSGFPLTFGVGGVGVVRGNCGGVGGCSGQGAVFWAGGGVGGGDGGRGGSGHGGGGLNDL